jgi:hypothetical protein
MRAFVAACVAIVAIATIGTFAMDLLQKPVSVAFATESVRI